VEITKKLGNNSKPREVQTEKLKAQKSTQGYKSGQIGDTQSGSNNTSQRNYTFRRKGDVKFESFARAHLGPVSKDPQQIFTVH
jgi:hypothetical protein